MLSEAKHLQYRVENMQMQILRCAQDDSLGAFSAAYKAPPFPAFRNMARTFVSKFYCALRNRSRAAASVSGFLAKAKRTDRLPKPGVP